nr:methionine--tRNA ligase [uncultured Lichenicoccus sp.]
MTERYTITTPIYYVNGSPHIGHAYTSIAADVMARWNRLDGRDVFFLTGTDEHGQKVEQAALAAGLPTQLFADKVAADFRAMADALHVSYDDFIRTTEPRHLAACAALWRRMQEAGQIYLGAYEGWYALRDESFYGEDELTLHPDGRRTAPSGAPVELVREPSYFFRLSEWQDRLLALYEANPDFIGPTARRNEVISFVRQGLKDLSISRTSFSWGVPVPDDPAHVMYVWCDALVNYITALGYPDTGPDNFRWHYWPADLHLVGKEIVRFHAVFWPAFLMAAGLELPRRVFSHGWWTIDGEKMSKSIGNVVEPRALAAEFGVDPVRYFLLREVPFGGDGDFSRKALIGRLNIELANDLGNLAQRTLSLVARNLDGRLPEAPSQGGLPPQEADAALLAQTVALPGLMREQIHRQALHEALEEVWRVVRASNGYIDRQAPWALKRTDPQRMAAVLRVLVDTLRTLATVLAPFMPSSMTSLLDQLGVPASSRQLADLPVALPPGTQLPPPVGIFPRHVEPVAG